MITRVLLRPGDVPINVTIRTLIMVEDVINQGAAEYSKLIIINSRD